MKKSKGIAWGLIIIGLGLIWGLKEANVINLVLFDGWWTLFIIIPSFIGLITDKNKTGSLVGLVVGGALLANYYVDLSEYKVFLLPAIAVLIGIGIIINAVTSKDKRAIPQEFENIVVENAPPQMNNMPPQQEYYSTFEGKNLVFNSFFNGGKFTATFGAIKLDLTRADIVPNSVINTSATFGAVDIKVPADVRVVVKSNNIFGGVSDKSNKNLPFDVKTLYINASNMFGGTEIK